MAGFFRKWAHDLQHAHDHRMEERRKIAERDGKPHRGDAVSFRAEIFHFLGEVEAIFGLWVVPLMIGIIMSRNTRS